jgi:hypothetical protein
LDQAAAQARVAAAARNALEPKTLWFEIATPDGRTLRVKHSSVDNLRAELLPKYTVRSQVFGADADGKGGFSIAIGACDSAAILKQALESAKAFSAA